MPLPVGKISAVCLAFLACGWPLFGQSDSPAKPASASPLPPGFRVVQLLWKSQPKSAASALEKLIEQALLRKETSSIQPALSQMAPQLRLALESNDDVRRGSAIAGLSLTGEESAKAMLAETVASGRVEHSQREFLLRVWLESARADALGYLQKTIVSFDANSLDGPDASQKNSQSVAWLETLALQGLQADLESTSARLLGQWSKLPKSLQIRVIEPLTQQTSSMKLLVTAVSEGRISKDLINTNQLSKWAGGKDAELVAAIEQIWGKLRSGEDADRKIVVQRTLQHLRSGGSGNPIAGQAVFLRVCSQCHKLHGEGIEVGPDISSNGRGNFEQLVSNVMDPSLVIGKAFLAKNVLTSDGRVLTGLVAAEDAKRITLKTQGGKLVELDRQGDIDSMTDSAKSLMPDGLEQQINPQELLDLFAYLSLTKALTAPENETIPGTPERLLAKP